MMHYEMLFHILEKFSLFHKDDLTYGCEVGVRHGTTAEYLLQQTKGALHLTLVDPYPAYQDMEHTYTVEEQEGICTGMLERMKPFKSFYEFMHKPSVEAAKGFDDELFDWVFIDAEHTYETCKADINAWWPKVTTGGALIGHDYSMDAVKFAVRDSFQERNVGIMAWTLPQTDIWVMFKE